jgi:hypothetical protein
MDGARATSVVNLFGCPTIAEILTVQGKAVIAREISTRQRTRPPALANDTNQAKKM